jgi:1-acyl-sn-glycerol-3-phosphate acyltransferase
MSRGFSPLASAGFATVFRPWMKRRFSTVSVTTPRAEIFRDVPLIFAANHVSWWDGFLLIELQRILRPRAPFHTIMLESELGQRPFLRHIGAIGIDPESPSTVLAAIRELSRRVEERPDSVIFFFPQGRIWPSYRRPLGFRRGIEVFCEAIDSVVLPVAIHIEPLNRIAPHAFVRAGEPLRNGDDLTAPRLEFHVQRELDDLMTILKTYGEDVDDHALRAPQADQRQA